MDNTLDIFAQIDKSFLSKQNQNLNKHAQKVIAALYIFQRVTNFPLLILKNYELSAPRRARNH
jgi:hypothetical protein